MLKDFNKTRMNVPKVGVYCGTTPLWDEFYVKSQNRKFKNKWDKIKAEGRK